MNSSNIKTNSASDTNKSSDASNNDIHRTDSFGNIALEFFDAMEVIYINNMLAERQCLSSSSSSSDDSPSVCGEFEDAAVSSSLSNAELTTTARPPPTDSLKGRVDANQKKLSHLARVQRIRLQNEVRARRKKLEQLLKDPQVVMTIDKISFVLGVLTIMLIEGVLLCAPDQMGSLYSALLIPLMVARYVIYKADFMHYFMYDFCYFSQVLLLLHMYKYPDDNIFAKAMFSICNGPILVAVVMWRNSLVFHNMDKMTSMFIHIFPAIVMFCKRWGEHMAMKKFPFYEEMNGTVYTNIVEFWRNPFVYYALWQVIYLIKTEWWSKQKLAYNPELMTSLRWMTKKKTSKSYRLLSYFGEEHQLSAFVVIQAIYTLLTFLMMPLLWHSIWLHGIYLFIIFVIALTNGATYYFHVFAVRYIEEVGKQV